MDAENWTMTVEESMAMIERAFFDRLSTTYRASEPPGADLDLEPQIRIRIEELGTLVSHLIENALDRANVHFTLLAVASYDVLCRALDQPQAMALVDECLNQPLRAWVLHGTRKLLDDAEDPFATLVAMSKERETSAFGPSFEFERAVDDGYGYVLNVRRCLFHLVLKACSRPELQPVLCRFDLNWIDAIDPVRHKMYFGRPSTFASADLCRMWFMRLEALPDRDERVRLEVLNGAKDR